MNSSYYRSQNPAIFAKWRDSTPEGFVFSVKASRFATHRRVLAEAGDAVQRFVDSGIAQLGDKLGPIVWQFDTRKPFDAGRLRGLLTCLFVEGVPLRHALDVRHESFKSAEYLALARRYGAVTVFTESDEYPAIADATGPFAGLPDHAHRSELPRGCTAEELDALAACARAWREGRTPAGLPLVEPESHGPDAPRDVFMFFISGAKERAPAAAMALIGRLG